MNDVNTDVGSWQTGRIDRADIAEFDNAGKGAASSAGALIHETSEQLGKAKKGLLSGNLGRSHIDAAGNRIYDDYNDAHNNSAIPSENKVNGNTRGFDGNENHFLEKNRSITMQTVTPTASGGVSISKTNINVNAIMRAIMSTIGK